MKFNKLPFALIIVFALGISLRCSSQKKEKPNIIFIFADDLGWGDLGAYGSDKIKTPALDQLASDGTMFTQFYVAGSVCSPSRAGIMSGMYPARNKIFGHFMPDHKSNVDRNMPDALDPDLLMITDVVKKEGYSTGHFGKWHMGNVSPRDYGIDSFSTNEYSNLESGKRINGWNTKNRPHSTKDVLEATLKFIKNNKGGPFYVNAWLFDMHAPLNPSNKQLDAMDRFRPRDLSNNKMDYYGIEQVYLATLQEMDKQIGLFLENLEEMGLAENTLIIFSSDNGPEDFQINNSAHSGSGSAGPFRGRKRSIYEGGIRVPLIVKWPGYVKKGHVNTTSVIAGIDFLPTISSIVGFHLPEKSNFDGMDMSDIWLGSHRQRETPLFWEWRYGIVGHVIHKSPMIAVRDGDYKLLINPDESRKELYNIVEDNSELNNLADRKPELTAQLVKKALDWYTSLPNGRVAGNAGKNSWNMPSEKK